MSKTMELLETLGRDATPRNRADFVFAVADVEPAAQNALLDGDQAALVAALGGRATMACSLALPERDEPRPEEEREPEEDPVQPPDARAA